MTTNKETEAYSKGRVRRLAAAGAMMILLCVSGAAQTPGPMLQQKDLAFPQVAAGPDFQSVVSLTNCGGETYVGAAHFWRGDGLDWNPRVNGIRVEGARLQLAIRPGRTRILRIDDDALAAGAVAILGEDPSQDNFIEGHLVYSRQGAAYDSVGIAPATQLYRSVVPFEDFETVGLALANPDWNGSANVRLRLLDEEGNEKESLVRALSRRSHEARFLNEIFATEAETGKVEIQSDVPILGTAMTLVEGQISALPMLASPVAYTVRFRATGRTDEAEAALWAEGAFVRGYIRFLSTNGKPYDEPETYLFSGTLKDGTLRLTQVGAGPQMGISETVNVLRLSGFSFDRRAFTGSYTRVFPWLSFPLSQILGTYEMVRRDADN